MKKIALCLAAFLLISQISVATIISVDFTLDPVTSTSNIFNGVLDIDLTFAGFGPASDSQNSTATGTTKMNLDVSIDPVTHEITSISRMEFVQELLTGPLSFSDITYNLVFSEEDYLDVNGTGIGGTMYTSQSSGTIPGVMSTVTNNTSFPGTEQYLGLDQGHFMLSGIMAHDWDLSGVDAMAFSAQQEPGTVAVSSPSIEGQYATYTIHVEQPLGTDYVVWNPGAGPTSIGNLYITGNLVMTGEATVRVGYTPGDADKNDVVDELDAAALAEHWLSGPGATWEQGDFNLDGYVDDQDATLLAANWDGSAAAVPEPASAFGLLAIALAGITFIRRR